MFRLIPSLQQLRSQPSWTPPYLKNEGHAAALVAFGLLAVYLWVLPTAHSIGLRHLAFFSLIFLTLWSAWRYKLRLHLPLATPWLLYAAIALLSATYAVDPIWSLGEIKKEIGYSLLVLMLSASWIKNIEALNRLILILVVGNLLQIGAVLYKITALDPFWQHSFLELSTLLYSGDGKSIYNGVGNLSTYLITVMPLIAAYTLLLPQKCRGLRSSLIALLALDVLALYLTGNRMGLIVLAAELIFATGYVATIIKKSNARFILSTTTIILIVLGTFAWASMQIRSPVDDIRWKVWDWIITDILATPLSGAGYGRTVLCPYDPGFCQAFPGLEHAHNILLNNGIQMGLPGIAAMLFLLGITARALWPYRHLATDLRPWAYALAATTMCLGVFLKNMTDDFFVDHNALLFWTLVGGVLGTLTEQRANTKVQTQ